MTDLWALLDNPPRDSDIIPESPLAARMSALVRSGRAFASLTPTRGVNAATEKQGNLRVTGGSFSMQRRPISLKPWWQETRRRPAYAEFDHLRPIRLLVNATDPMFNFFYAECARWRPILLFDMCIHLGYDSVAFVFSRPRPPRFDVSV